MYPTSSIFNKSVLYYIKCGDNVYLLKTEKHHSDEESNKISNPYIIKNIT